ncbi:MAG: flagellar assembly protein FliW [Vicinamibacterales bacterium]
MTETTMTIPTELVIQFPDGLPGFESCQRFLLYSSPDTAPIRCLHAIEGPKATFLTVEAAEALADFRHQLSGSDRLRLEAADDARLLWLAVVTVDDDGPVTANLRAPIVINLDRQIGYQIMPHQCVYPLRHPLAQAA